MLAINKDTQVIHMDYILESIKQKRMFNSITRNVKLQQNNDDMHRIMNPRLSDFLYDSNIRLKEHFENLCYDYTYRESSGAHNWAFWDEYIQYVLKWMFD